jgi:hypothetical protein
MRKSIKLTFIFAVLSLGSAFGQLGLDISAGINNSSVEFKNLAIKSSDARNGYFVGLAPTYKIGKRFKVLVDLQYSQKGFQETILNTVEIQNRIIYFDIIPEVEFKMFNFLSIGTGVNYGIKTKLEFKDDITDWQNGNGVDFLKSYDFGLTGKIKVSFSKLFAFARYNHGLSNIDALKYILPSGEELTGNKTLNRNLQLGVGIGF